MRKPDETRSSVPGVPSAPAVGRAMATRDIALELLVARALDRSDQRLFRLMIKRVGVALRTQRDNGTVRSEQGPGMFVLWEVTR